MKAPRALVHWIDTSSSAPAPQGADRIDWLRVLPFLGLHLGCLLVFVAGVSAAALWTAAALYALRMFAITAFYHRFFSHRAFRTSRPMQFLFALLGAASVQRGPLWWAAHHRHHHRHADTERDVHAPRHGFWRSHVGWFLSTRNFATDHAAVRDLARYPELRWLDRFDIAVPVALAAGLYGFGAWLGPEHATSGLQMLAWGFFVSTVLLFHATVTINSLAHRFGRRRYATGDDSRNNWLLALLTFGEGWHNNHHHFPGAARQGVAWWELDLTWYALRALAALGLVWDLRVMPATVRSARMEPASTSVSKRP